MAELLFICAAALGALAAFFRPGVALGFVLSGFVVEQFLQSVVPITATHPALVNFLFSGYVALAVGGQILRRGLATVRMGPVAAMGIALVLYCLLSLVWSIYPQTTLEKWLAHAPYVLVFFVLGPLAVGRPRDLRDALDVVLFASFFSLLGLLFFGDWEGRSIVLLSGVDSNPLALTEAAGALLILAGLSPRVQMRSRGQKLLWMSAILLVVGLIFLRTASRGQIISSLLVLLIFTARRGGLKIFALGTLLAALFLGSLWESEVATHAARWSPENMQGELARGRVSFVETLYQFWSEAPILYQLFGLGHAASQDPRLLGTYPHLVAFEVLAEEGFFGWGLLCLMLFLSYRSYQRLLRAVRSSEYASRVVLSAAALTLYSFLLTFKQGALLGSSGFLLLLVLPEVARWGKMNEEAKS